MKKVVKQDCAHKKISIAISFIAMNFEQDGGRTGPLFIKTDASCCGDTDEVLKLMGCTNGYG